MSNYPTFLCHLIWTTGDYPDLGERVLRSQPHRGDAIWVPVPEEGFNFLVRVEDVVHVAETEEEFPYLEVWVTLEQRERIREEQEDSSPCGIREHLEHRAKRDRQIYGGTGRVEM